MLSTYQKCNGTLFEATQCLLYNKCVMVHYFKENNDFLHSKNIMEQYVKLKMLSTEQKYNGTLFDTNQCFVHSKSVIKH